MTRIVRNPLFTDALAVLAVTISILHAFARPAGAGDLADRNILGFSPDGGTFAFEQFGVQDGSGFPYTDIFVVDTLSDQWVKGSPFRVLMRDERSQLKWARREALTKAGNTLRQRQISKPGRLLASNPPAELSADPHRVVVNVSQIVIGPPERWTFTLDEIPIANEQCAAFTSVPVKGFRLYVQRQGGAPLKLHEDTSIPKSRGCPLRYAISDVVAYEPDGGSRVIAVLVSVFSHGFEGPDRRFLAVTKRFE
jgi:predicted secreted protein